VKMYMSATAFPRRIHGKSHMRVTSQIRHAAAYHG
jgi:hypothetical protein